MSDPIDVITATAELRQRQAELFAQATEERGALIARLGSLCGLLGPITRSDLPDGVLRRRHRKAPQKPATRRRGKGKAEAAAPAEEAS